MLMPKKTKYRKVQRGRMSGISKGARSVTFGEYGLCALEPGWISARQIEAVRVTVNRKLKAFSKTGELFVRMFPDKPITKKPAETRMGKGKGNPEFWVAVVKRGRVLVEVTGINREQAKQILKLAAYKISVKTKFVSKEDGDVIGGSATLA